MLEFKLDEAGLIEQLASSTLLDTLLDNLKSKYGRSILNTDPQEKNLREHTYMKSLVIDDLRIELQNLFNNYEPRGDE